MPNQEMKQAVEQLVDKIVASETSAETVEAKAEDVEKAMPSSLPANGGKDEIKSGSPMSEKQEMMSDKKKDEAKKAEKEEDEDEEDEKKEKKDKMKMKKSLEELAEHLDETELELIKTWREEEAKEEVITKSEETKEDEKKEDKQEDLAKSIAKAIEDSIAPLRKALEDKDGQIKGLSEKVEKMASQPAYDRRSIASLETIEKSQAGAEEISKSQVTNKMLELQVAGKGVTSHHIAEFEATNNISDPIVKSLVFKELKLN